MIVERINITKASIKRTLSMIMALLMIITSLSVSAFAVDTSGKNFDYYIEDGEVTILDNYCSDNESITIPEKIEGYPVTIIAEKAFSECKASEITIPETVVQICYSAFYGCQNLKNITIPDSVTSLGDSAFNNCSELTSVTISNNIKEIGQDTFINCSGLTSVTIPDSITSIGYRAFGGCESLKNVLIGKNVMFCDYAFIDCNSLFSFTVDESNRFYSSDENGVLFNKDKTVLIQYPIGNIRTEYTIPSSVRSICHVAFGKCNNLTNVTIPNSVTEIESYAFYDCDGIKNVTIPNSVTSIGWSAFEYCDGLTSVSISDSVTSIDGYVFYGCSGLNNIKIGNGIKKIDNTVFSNTGYYNNEENWVDNVLYIDNCLIEAKTDISGEYSIKEGTRIIPEAAFRDCRNLTGITIPESVEYISRYAFSGCSNLRSATLENGINSIENSAFKTCISLTSISIPDSVEKIGTNAFYGCLNLKTISIGSGIKSVGQDAFAETGYLINEDNWSDNVLYIDNCLIKAKKDITGDYAVKDGATVIADYAFYDCNNLADVTIPDSVTNIGDRAFYSCNSLSTIKIGKSLTNIGYSAFRYCDKLNSITVDGRNQQYSSDEYGVLFNKDKTELIKYPVGKERTEYIIPNSVTSIGDSAFYGCNGLTNVTISNSVTTIGDEAFYNCNGLTNVTIPDSVTIIGSCAFYDCYNLTIDSLSSGLTSISSCAFYNCNNLAIDSLPSGLTNIDNSVFEDCDNIASIVIPASVTRIGDDAFKSCKNLKKISVDESNHYYSSDEYGVLFNKDKTELIQYPIGNERTEYIIPNSITSIGDYAFYNCNGLANVTIPGSVTSIGDDAFNGCTGLTNVTIPNSVTYINGSTFYGCTSLTNVTIPNSITYIDDYAFYGCTSLVVEKLPRRLISIGSYAFANCENIVSIIIPVKVTYIASNAFSDCINLEGIFVDADNPEYSSDDFGVLFNKDKTELIQYPIGNERTSYTVPETVKSINYNSFKNCDNIVSVTIPKSIKFISLYAFNSCDNLNTVYYSGSPSMWNKIYVSPGNDKLKNATIIYAEEDSESGETVETKKETVSDEATDVSVEYISNFHEGEVGLEVERTFDGKAFDVISTQLDINSNEIYDIKMTIDGVVTQPNGKVKVKIPIPTGYDPAKTFVYHVNTNSGTVENMNAVVDGNYLVFETDHFSYYAVVEVKDAVPDEPAEQSYKITWNIDGKITEQEYKAGDVITAPQNPVKSGYRFVGWSPAVPTTMPSYDLTFTAVFEKLSSPAEDGLTVSIRTPSTASVDYGDSIILHLDIDRPLPDGAYIEWSESNGNFDMSTSADGLTCKISPKSSGKTVFIATVYDKDGNVISSDTQEMNAKAGLWQKIVAFFKKIFGLTKTFPEAFKGIF